MTVKRETKAKQVASWTGAFHQEEKKWVVIQSSRQRPLRETLFEKREPLETTTEFVPSFWPDAVPTAQEGGSRADGVAPVFLIQLPDPTLT